MHDYIDSNCSARLNYSTADHAGARGSTLTSLASLPTMDELARRDRRDTRS